MLACSREEFCASMISLRTEDISLSIICTASAALLRRVRTYWGMLPRYLYCKECSMVAQKFMAMVRIWISAWSFLGPSMVSTV